MLSPERGIIGIKSSDSMPRRSRRTREEITYEILKILKSINGSTISHIMQKARLNYYQAKNYLASLAGKGYIMEKNGFYVLLNMGREFISRYEALKLINKKIITSNHQVRTS